MTPQFAVKTFPIRERRQRRREKLRSYRRPPRVRAELIFCGKKTPFEFVHLRLPFQLTRSRSSSSPLSAQCLVGLVLVRQVRAARRFRRPERMTPQLCPADGARRADDHHAARSTLSLTQTAASCCGRGFARLAISISARRISLATA